MERRVVPNGRLRRTLPLAALTGRVASEALVASLSERFRDNANSDARAEFHHRAAQRYADQLSRSKGVLMKAGQILSFTTLGPVFEGENVEIWRRALARLQDDAAQMPFEIVASVIEQELGASPDDVFAWFDPTPLAAASIGQVHAARTHDDRDIVVKVQYPGVDEAIRADLRNTELLATFLQLIRGVLPDIQRLDARLAAAEISTRIGEELDYWTEASNQSVFAEAYRGHPFIKIPEVIPQFCTERVLTMERVHGRKFADVLDAPPELRNRWGEVIQRFALGSIRRMRLFHADPHPGNYLFHDDGTVSFLDFGCVRRFTAEQVRLIQAMTNSGTSGDADASLATLTALGIFDPADLPDAQTTLAWHRAWLADYAGAQPFTYSPDAAAEIARAFLSPVGPFREVVTRAGLDSDYIMLTRIQLGVVSVLGALRATGPWEAIRQEWDNDGEPATPFGELDHAFWNAKARR